MKQETHRIFIRPDGTVEAVYSDLLAPLLAGSKTQSIKRVSFVEPDAAGRWVADMGPVGGPCSPPFQLRSDALAWEAAYLTEQLRANAL